jgi:hypothetical protein
MYLASLINKGREVYRKGSTDPTVLPAETILKMATINGAKAVLWDKEIGSLEVGKKVRQVHQCHVNSLILLSLSSCFIHCYHENMKDLM